MNLGPSSTQSATSLKAATLTAPPLEEATVEVTIEEEELIQPTPPQPKSFLDDGFVFGLEGSGLERPKGKVSQIVVEGDTTVTQPYQVGIVASTMINHMIVAIYAIYELLHLYNGAIIPTVALSVITSLSSWLIADLGSGILHWSVDNYGNGKTPIMGNLIAAFQGHHSAPWTITERGFCNNVYKLCTPFGIPTVLGIAWLAGPSHPMVALFFTIFCTMEIMSQEFHKWSHMTKADCGPVITKLQDIGIAIGRRTHGLHHVAPYEGNYCIVSGTCNNALDKSGFFRWLEHMVYNMNGVESNSWKLDPQLKARTLRGEYKLNLDDYS